MRLSSLAYALPTLALVLVGLVASACSDDSPRPRPEPAATVASPIINGNLDTTHEAVVALILQNASSSGLCSGTIIKVDAASHIGWVLTAAHCVNDVPPVEVFQGDDFTKTTGVLRYKVIDYAADPGYTNQAGSPHDFGVVRIAGVDATTPTLPLVTAPDGLAQGSKVVSVGYGRTTLIASGTMDENTQRRNVAKVLNQVGSSQIGFDMAEDGICQGDSGGPVLVTSGGGEQVVGVHSFVNGDCNGQGVSGRVTFGMSFISGQLLKPVPTEDCTLCQSITSSGNGACAQLTVKCLADADCKGFNDCIANKGTIATCAVKFPKGEGPYDTAIDCACNTACVATCGTSLTCKNVPKCGFKFPAGDCTTCSEGACCDETLACGANGTCYHCLKDGDTDPECATNAARVAMATCEAAKCSTECAGTGLDHGADAGAPDTDAGEGAGATTTITTKGCSIRTTGGPARSADAGFVMLGLAAVVIARRRVRRR